MENGISELLDFKIFSGPSIITAAYFSRVGHLLQNILKPLNIWTILCLIQVIQAMRKSTQKQRLLEIELYCITSQVRARVKFIFCFNSCVKMVSQRDTNCIRSFSQLSIVRINSCFDLSLHFKEVSINTVSINFPKRF